MFTRNAILIALFVLATGAMAADKPAVQARERMEAEARGQTTAPIQGYFAGGGGTVIETPTKPAVAYRLAREAPAAAGYQPETAVATGGAEKHPVANVGYGVIAQPKAVGYEVQPLWENQATKPAVQYRLAREQQ